MDLVFEDSADVRRVVVQIGDAEQSQHVRVGKHRNRHDLLAEVGQFDLARTGFQRFDCNLNRCLHWKQYESVYCTVYCIVPGACHWVTCHSSFRRGRRLRVDLRQGSFQMLAENAQQTATANDAERTDLIFGDARDLVRLGWWLGGCVRTVLLLDAVRMRSHGVPRIWRMLRQKSVHLVGSRQVAARTVRHSGVHFPIVRTVDGTETRDYWSATAINDVPINHRPGSSITRHGEAILLSSRRSERRSGWFARLSPLLTTATAADQREED